MKLWIRVAGVVLCVAWLFSSISCTSLRQAHLKRKYSSSPFLREVSTISQECIARLHMIRPNIVVGRLKEMREIRDSDVLSVLGFSTSALPDVIISYKGSNESWRMRHAVPEEGFLEFLEKDPDLYECLIYIAENLGITPYCSNIDGIWCVFLFDSISGEQPEDYLPLQAKVIPFNYRAKGEPMRDEFKGKFPRAE